MKVVCVQGYFDPLIPSHVVLFQKAKAMGDCLVVVVNNDKQAIGKKGYYFMPAVDRMEIIRAIKCVDEVMLSVDEGGCETIRLIKPNLYVRSGGWTYQNTDISILNACKDIGCELICVISAHPDHSSDYLQRFLEYKSIGKGDKLSDLCWSEVCKKRAIAATCVAVADKSEKVLFVRRGGLWQLPGGGINANETPEMGAIRELEEETGIRITASQLSYLTTVTSFNPDKTDIVLTFLVTIDEPIPVQLSEEHDAYEWIKLANADSYNINKATQQQVKALNENLNQS